MDADSVRFLACLHACSSFTTGAVVGAGTLPIGVCVCKSVMTTQVVSTMTHFRDNYQNTQGGECKSDETKEVLLPGKDGGGKLSQGIYNSVPFLLNENKGSDTGFVLVPSYCHPISGIYLVPCLSTSQPRGHPTDVR